MSVRSVSVNRHDRYTPELRGKVPEAPRVPLFGSASRPHAAAAEGTGRRILTMDRWLWRAYLSSVSDTMLRSIEDSRMRQGLQEAHNAISASPGSRDRLLYLSGGGVAVTMMPPTTLVSRRRLSSEK
jgi:hypothetical protein